MSQHDTAQGGRAFGCDGGGVSTVPLQVVPLLILMSIDGEYV